jgi:AcrR family transcriptional regulator
MSTPAATSDDTAPARAKRADAVRNRAAVVRAAAEVFTEQGADVGVEVIAERAGVGKATVYRSFPTKEHLVAAVATERLEWLADLTEDSLDAPDPLAAMRAIYRAAVDTRARGMLALGLGLDSEHADLLAAKARCTAAGELLMRRAQADGLVRTDMTYEDVGVHFRGVMLALLADGEDDPAAWRRHADLALDILRP